MSQLTELSGLFAASGHSLYLVGGPVRDVLLGRTASDLDCTTDARPDEIEALLGPWADEVWTQGAAFGTVAAVKDGMQIEVTTHRSEVYVPESRKPSVSFGASIDDDLARRDFTINAMAVDLAAMTLHDPYGGREDLEAGVLRTPDDPVVTFSEDPLRMLRAARFCAQLGFTPTGEVEAAVCSERSRTQIVSAERIGAELAKLVVGPKAPDGLRFLVRTRLSDELMPELSGMAGVHQNPAHHDRDVFEHTMGVVEAIAPTLRLRLAALFHDVGKPHTKDGPEATPTFYGHEDVGAELTQRRLSELRFPGHVVDDVAKLVRLHMRAHGTEQWSDRAVRRYCRDAGELIEDLHALMEADRRAHAPAYAPRIVGELSELKRRIAELSRREPVNEFRPELDGDRVMQILGIPPGPVVGEAMRELLELRLDRGLVGPAEAERHLRAWWAAR
jgi:poly(A) polymerase